MKRDTQQAFLTLSQYALKGAEDAISDLTQEVKRCLELHDSFSAAVLESRISELEGARGAILAYLESDPDDLQDAR